MPVFRFSRAFRVAQGVKAFLNLEGGFTRGAVPDVERSEELSNARQLVREQRKALKGKDREIKELAKNLTAARRHSHEHKQELYWQRLEIFQRNNELAATREVVKNAQDGLLAPHASGALEVGRLPDFVVIGAQKCGTGSFYNLLTRHPNVERAAVKEVHYFDKQENFSKGIEWYRRCFPSPSREDGRRSITGEASPSYLINRHAPERLAGAVPEARLIVLLRNPVDRAYSHYHMAVRNGNELRSFEEAVEEERAWLLKEEDEPSRPGLADSPDAGSTRAPMQPYLRRGIYVDQLLRWREFFGEDQLLVLRSKELFERPQESLEPVLEYLGLPYWEPEIPSHKAKHRYEPMDPASRQRLEVFFEPHNRRLYEHLGVDLS